MAVIVIPSLLAAHHVKPVRLACGSIGRTPRVCLNLWLLYLGIHQQDILRCEARRATHGPGMCLNSQLLFRMHFVDLLIVVCGKVILGLLT